MLSLVVHPSYVWGSSFVHSQHKFPDHFQQPEQQPHKHQLKGSFQVTPIELVVVRAFPITRSTTRLNLIIPSPRGLFQTIQGFIQSTNKTGILHKTRRFLHINLFSYISMNQITFDIPLMYLPSKSSSKWKNQSKRIHLCDRGKGFNVVDAFLLRKPLCY